MARSKNDYTAYDPGAAGFTYTGSESSGGKTLASEIDVGFVIRAVKSRLKLFSLLLILVLAGSMVITLRKIPFYSATCRIILSPEQKSYTGFEDLFEASDLGYVERNTEILRITSFKNIQAVANSSSLNTNDPVFKEKSIDEKAGAIRGSFTAKEVFDTYMIDVSCEWHDPDVAKEHANLLAKVFLQDYKERKSGISKKGLDLLKEKADSILKDFEKKSQELHSFEALNNLISIDKDHQSLAILRLSSLMNYQIETETERIALEVELKSLKEANQLGSLDFDGSIVRNPKILGLKNDIKEEEVKLIRLTKNKGDNNIDVVNQKSLILSLKEKIFQEMQTHISTIESDYHKHFQREQLLISSLSDSKNQYNKNVVHYKHLKNQVATIETALNKILQRIQEIEIANTLELDSEFFGIYSLANKPFHPSRPNKVKEFTFGVMFALVVAGGVCFLLELTDPTLKSKTDIESLLGIPVVSYIPKFPDPVDEIPVINNPNSIVAESFRALRTTLLLTKGSKEGRIFMLTSTSASEGKTSFSANLALCMQQQGKKVLLIETDFRKSRMEEIFESEVQKGLSNYLMDPNEVDFSDYLKKVSSGLDIFFAGPTPFNPTELLQSEKFDQFLKVALMQYDYVFISTTPTSSLSDARIIAAKEEVVTLFLVRAYSTQSKLASAAVKDLINVGANIVGVVVNGVDVPIKGADNYSEYTSYYGKYSDFDD